MDGPYVHSYIYLFEKAILRDLDYVIEIFPDEEIVVYIENLAKINFRTFYSSKVLQTIRIDGFSGVALVLGGVRVKIQGNDIICSLVTEPFTYKDLWAPMYFVFEKEF